MKWPPRIGRRRALLDKNSRASAVQLLIWGDVVHVPEVQVALPDAGTNFDVDYEQARKSRKKILDQVATDRLLVTGMHLHFPGFHYVARQGDGYFLHAEAWHHGL